MEVVDFRFTENCEKEIVFKFNDFNLKTCSERLIATTSNGKSYTNRFSLSFVGENNLQIQFEEKNGINLIKDEFGRLHVYVKGALFESLDSEGRNKKEFPFSGLLRSDGKSPPNSLPSNTLERKIRNKKKFSLLGERFKGRIDFERYAYLCDCDITFDDEFSEVDFSIDSIESSSVELIGGGTAKINKIGKYFVSERFEPYVESKDEVYVSLKFDKKRTMKLIDRFGNEYLYIHGKWKRKNITSIFQGLLIKAK